MRNAESEAPAEADEWQSWCSECGRKGDACTCWMRDPVYTGEATP